MNVHGGKLPVSIKAIPEGTVVPTKNVLMTIENTDPKCYWLTNYLETLLLQVWYPITVATLSREMKKHILNSLRKSADTTDSIGFKLHDFGFRGASSVETAAIGASAHLVNFMGTDTMPGILLAMEYYKSGMAGFSIPASEHSTITSHGEENELNAMENMLDKYPTGTIACVSDSYNIYRAVGEYFGTKLHDKIMNRNGCLTIRPVSGDPITLLPELLNIAWDKFGGHVNTKGYKVLDSHVRFIWGDGISYDSIVPILNAIMDAGFSTENLAFGMGGALLQMVNRDTQKFAFKCSAIRRNGEWHDVYKNPIHSSFKKSKKGRLGLFMEDGVFVTKAIEDEKMDKKNLLKEVFRDGRMVKTHKFADIRKRAEIVG